jgi:DNA mismatch endonuclease (patch repair protein)
MTGAEAPAPTEVPARLIPTAASAAHPRTHLGRFEGVSPEGIPGPSSGPPESWATTPAVRNVMRANKSRDTKPELAVRRDLHARGLRYRVSRRPLPGARHTADVVFGPARVAVFIDGCFWHGCPEHHHFPRSNPDYWRAKLERNQLRDRKVDSLLEEHGWLALRFWEHESPHAVADAIESVVRSRRTS